jgi:hypothetical protein
MMRRLSSLRVELPPRRLMGVLMLLGLSWLHAQCFPLAPDIEVRGTPLGAYGAYLWGQEVEIDVDPASPPYSGESYRIEYSLDGGPWTTAASNVTSFPVTISLPPFAPPRYDGILEIRAVAVCTAPPHRACRPLHLYRSIGPAGQSANKSYSHYAEPLTLNTWTLGSHHP